MHETIKLIQYPMLNSDKISKKIDKLNNISAAPAQSVQLR